MLWPRGFSSFTHALISQKSCNRKRYYGGSCVSRKIFTSCGSFLFFRPLSWGNEAEKNCFPIARGGGRDAQWRAGQREGRSARRRNHTPSVLVRKVATIEAKLPLQGCFPTLIICSLWVSFWIYATNLRLKARSLLAGARMTFRKKWQSGNET